MPFSELTPHGELLLKEIYLHRNEYGYSDSDYWERRFSELNYSEENRLRTLFEELEDNKIIITQWAEDIPYEIILSSKGISYFEYKNIYEKEKKQLSKREWRIATVSTIIGAALGLIPFILTTLEVI